MTARRSLSLFGATGSIGSSTLALVRDAPGAWRVEVLAAGRDALGLARLARAFRPARAVIADPDALGVLQDAVAGTGIAVSAGSEAMVAAAEQPADLTVAAITGYAGLATTMAALSRGGAVALANKESLVAAGPLMLAAAQASNATILPVDSEHNAIFQCLAGNSLDDVSRIILTASGGPFRTWDQASLRTATVEQAVAHPNWSMGAKISVDSATMMNKGLELIEAFHLFPVGLDRLSILVHPQSVVHSMVEYRDRSMLAQLGPSDMRVPIASAMAWPGRMDTACSPLDLAAVGRLDFEPVDEVRFPATALCRAAIAEGGGRPAQLNAANEVAVAAFLDRRIGFTDIATVVASVMDLRVPDQPEDLQSLFTIDARSRADADTHIDRMTR